MIKSHRIISCLCAALLALSVSGPGECAIEFSEHTTDSGISYLGPSFGVSWGDLNGDGFPDAWAGSHWREPLVFLNRGDGSFDTLRAYSAWTGDNHGAAWADFDNDGDQDLIMLNGAAFGRGSDPNRLFINDSGSFTEEAVEHGIDYPLGRGRTPTWIDWNNDGFLDVLLSNWKRPDRQAPTNLFTQQGSAFTPLSGSGEIVTSADNQFGQITMFDSDRPGFVIHANAYPDSAYEYSSDGVNRSIFDSRIPDRRQKRAGRHCRRFQRRRPPGLLPRAFRGGINRRSRRWGTSSASCCDK